MADPRDVATDRLTTADEKGKRVWIYPSEVSGKFRLSRNILIGILVFVFLITPWIRIGENPLILLDIPNRKFSIFGILFWAHDAPMLFFVFGGIALSLFFVTAIWGRVWCGWACPQTVFVDGVFRKIEAWVEGKALQRQRLDQGPLTGEKIQKKLTKWFLYLLVSLVISHSFIAYFVGTSELALMIRTSPYQNPTSFMIMAFITVVILLDFGWFREQFCIIACPYGRFQSVLMDVNSMVVAYDKVRGEPRKNKDVVGQKDGDCVNCFKCVRVCPTGIDIRNGVQMECIACTACIDACDDVMVNMGRQPGLIRYASDAMSKTRFEKPFEPRLGVRAILYSCVLLLFVIGLTYSVKTHEMVEAMFVRAIGSPYSETKREDGTVEVFNLFRLDLHNQSFGPLKVELKISEEWIKKGVQIVRSEFSDELKAGVRERSNVFVKFPKSAIAAGHAILPITVMGRQMTLHEGEKLISFERELHLVGPF